MGLFGKRGDSEMLHSYLKNSFSNVKKDTSALFQWIQFLHSKLQQQEQVITSLHTQLNSQLLTPKDIKHLVDAQFDLQNIQSLHHKVNHLNRKIEIMTSLHDTHNSRISELHHRLENADVTANKRSSSLKEKIIKKLTRNSKSYVKNTILGYIEKYQEIPALQLKEMLVEEQGICSKSSFYRLLQELEDQDRVGVIKDGKQKVYMAKSVKHIQR